MIIKWTTAVISALAISASVQAQTADVESSKMGLNLEALGGMRWGHVDLEETAGQDKSEAFYRAQEFKVGANYQLPQLPVAAGLNLGFINYNNKDTMFEAEHAYEFDTTLEAKVWVPADILPTQDMVIPYVKVAYTPFSIYKQEVKRAGQEDVTQKIDGDNKGYSVGVGTNVKIVDNFSGVVEYTYSQRKLVADDTDTKQKVLDNKLASHGVLVGVTAHM